jgi:hypothetical protein
MLSIHLRLGLPSGLFPSDFPTNNLYTFLFSIIRAKISLRLSKQIIILKNMTKRNGYLHLFAFFFDTPKANLKTCRKKAILKII